MCGCSAIHPHIHNDFSTDSAQYYLSPHQTHSLSISLPVQASNYLSLFAPNYPTGGVWWLALSWGVMVGSMLSKEQGITVLGVCVVYDFMEASQVRACQCASIHMTYFKRVRKHMCVCVILYYERQHTCVVMWCCVYVFVYTCFCLCLYAICTYHVVHVYIQIALKTPACIYVCGVLY